MAGNRQKLELNWVGKGAKPRLEPRILLPDPGLSHHAPHKKPGDIFDNLLIHGDNLLALKALEAEYTGKVKCVYIDPPYNTGSAFQHYEDGLEHSIWLSIMHDRLELLRNLLSEDGSIWITIDDNEAHYLKVLCDSIFGRANFIANVVWQKRTSPDARLALGDAHDSILVYARSGTRNARTYFKKLSLSEDQTNKFQNPDNDPRGSWVSTDFTAQGYRPNQMYEIVTPNGAIHVPPPGRCWANIESEYKKLLSENRMWFGKDGKARPRIKTYLNETTGIQTWTWWPNTEVGHNQEAKKEINELFGPDNPFDTPKPERLIERILTIATNPGDLVLDSFAGSGTTGAVAHKMGRRWIMVELGDHCHTHIVPRMKKVIDGTDQGGISKKMGWQGGGGYRYCRLAPSLLARDTYDQWVINPKYNAEMLAEAMCKLMGFAYAPSKEFYWRHGQGSERSFIYVTTARLSEEGLWQLSGDVGPEDHLLVCCPAYFGQAEQYPNLTLAKIPQAVLKRCAWGKDDYSLKVANLPIIEKMPQEVRKRIVKEVGDLPLFAEEQKEEAGK